MNFSSFPTRSTVSYNQNSRNGFKTKPNHLRVDSSMTQRSQFASSNQSNHSLSTASKVSDVLSAVSNSAQLIDHTQGLNGGAQVSLPKVNEAIEQAGNQVDVVTQTISQGVPITTIPIVPEPPKPAGLANLEEPIGSAVQASGETGVTVCGGILKIAMCVGKAALGG